MTIESKKAIEHRSSLDFFRIVGSTIPAPGKQALPRALVKDGTSMGHRKGHAAHDRCGALCTKAWGDVV
jgi:hypothetical protein